MLLRHTLFVYYFPQIAQNNTAFPLYILYAKDCRRICL